MHTITVSELASMVISVKVAINAIITLSGNINLVKIVISFVISTIFLF